MLKAIIYSKARRVSIDEQESVRWADAYKQYEDLLTAAVFGRFAYLSESLQNGLLHSWFRNQITDKRHFYGFEEIKFWPKYKKQTLNSVEPDILIRFEHCNLLIEVKPPLGGNQKLDQWKNETSAFLDQPENNDKPLHFLAIGRIKRHDSITWLNILKQHSDNQYPHKLRHTAALTWQPIANSIINLLFKASEKISKIDKRVLSDILQALKLYGLNTTLFHWSDLSKSILANSTIELNYPLLSKLKISTGTKKPKPMNSFKSFPKEIQKFSPLNLSGIIEWTKI
ncbi:MAG: hypothetical protein RPS47_18640 [Colwellia sp.]|jgi:hypothetical protein